MCVCERERVVEQVTGCVVVTVLSSLCVEVVLVVVEVAKVCWLVFVLTVSSLLCCSSFTCSFSLSCLSTFCFCVCFRCYNL